MENGDRPDPEAVELTAPEPDVYGNVAPPLSRGVQFAICGLFILGFAYTLYLAKPLLMPIILATMLTFLLGPLVRGLRRLAVPVTVGAALVLTLILVTLGLGTYHLASPAAEWIQRAPQTFRQLGLQARELMKPVEQVTKAADEAEKLADMTVPSQATQVEIRRPSFSDVVVGATWELVLGGVVVVALVYFLLSSGDLFLEKLIEILPRIRDKERLVGVARRVEREISTYLVTLFLINAALGIVVSLVLAWLGLPNPALWGVVAGVLNFVPYLGALTTAAILALVSAATFDDLSRVLVVVGAFLTITTLEGLIIQPLIVGRRLALNPVFAFVALMFWGWIWGIPGALLAVPLLAVTKVLLDEIPSLAPFGAFLGR